MVGGLSLAALEKEVRAFPEGLETVVGEKGVPLRGGSDIDWPWLGPCCPIRPF